jgi:hypothetical protein
MVSLNRSKRSIRAPTSGCTYLLRPIVCAHSSDKDIARLPQIGNSFFPRHIDDIINDDVGGQATRENLSENALVFEVSLADDGFPILA